MRSILMLSLLCLMAFSTKSGTLTAGQISITRTSDYLLAVDSNNCTGGDGPRAAYIAFRIDNTDSVALSNLEVTLSALDVAAGFDFLNSQAPTQYIGTLAPGASVYRYWAVLYACTQAVTDTVNISVSDGAGAVSINENFTTNSSISAKAGGDVVTKALGPGAVVGQIIPFTVTYEFGSAKAGDRYNLQPVGNTDFDARCFQLVGVSVTRSQVTAIPVSSIDAMFYIATERQGGGAHEVDVNYSYRYLCAGISTQAVSYGAQTSGATNEKYSGNFGAQAPLTFPLASNPFSISKIVNKSNFPDSTGGAVTYTLTISNVSAFSIGLDGVVDDLPAGVAYDALDASSDITLLNSSQAPLSGASGTLTWLSSPENPYQIAAGSAISLVYSASIPPSNGDYINSAKALVGLEQTNTDQVTVTVGPIADLSVGKSADNVTPPEQQDFVYTLIVTNNGPNPATAVNVVDALPAAVTYFSDVATQGSFVDSTGLWSVGNLDTGASESLSITVRSNAGTGGSEIINTISDTSADQLDLEASNNTASVSVTPRRLPNILMTKASTVFSDPVNGAVNAKAIPGAIINYSISASNQGFGVTDSESVAVHDDVPANTTLYVGDIGLLGSGPVDFQDGTPGSSLAYGFTALSSMADNLSFSDNDGATYDYAPSPDANGFDAGVTHIRITPAGQFAASDGVNHPNFTLQFRVRVN